MATPFAYLNFNGNCAEAMRFYERVLDGTMKSMMTFGESPMCAQMPPGSEQKILNAHLMFEGGGNLMASDHMMGPYEGIKGVALTLIYDSTEQAEKVFNALAEGGKITMPVQAMFWAKSFGMLVDRFGVAWSVNGEMIV
ncbi:MAG: VOC family protein [Casimicrobium sp.]